MAEAWIEIWRVSIGVLSASCEMQQGLAFASCFCPFCVVSVVTYYSMVSRALNIFAKWWSMIGWSGKCYSDNLPHRINPQKHHSHWVLTHSTQASTKYTVHELLLMFRVALHALQGV